VLKGHARPIPIYFTEWFMTTSNPGTTSTQPAFFKYASGSGQVNFAYGFKVMLGGSGPRSIEMDTGSTGIVVPLSAIGEYTVASNPPDYTPSYSSSGNSYTGQWVETVVTIIDADGNSFTTPKPILVFGATYPEGSPEAEGKSSGVSMMGVSTRFPEADAYNPFLNHPDIVNGTFRSGYILSEEGVLFGYGEQDIASFSVFPTTITATPPTRTTPQTQTRAAQAQVTLTPPDAAKGLKPYTETTFFLMDTGIDYSITTPRTTPETANGTAPTPPVPNDWQVTVPQSATAPERMQLISGVTVAVSLLDAQGAYQPVWSFNTKDFGQPTNPAYARLAVPSADGIFNTGRHFMATYNYLADLTGSQIGIRKLTT
jgi:hypothetical protein